MSSEEWSEAENRLGICLTALHEMPAECWLCTDSGAVKLYVVGRLDNGEVFAEKCDPKFEAENYEQ